MTHKHKRKIFIHKSLETCSHVFLKIVKSARKSLECPYSGPHKIFNRISDQVYEIEVNGVRRNVSVENIKPAYCVREDLNGNENVLPVNQNVQTGTFGPSHISNPLPNSNFLASPNLRTYVNKKKKVSFVKGTKQ